MKDDGEEKISIDYFFQGAWLLNWIGTSDPKSVIKGIPGDLVSSIIKETTKSYEKDTQGTFFNLSNQ